MEVGDGGEGGEAELELQTLTVIEYEVDLL